MKKSLKLNTSVLKTLNQPGKQQVVGGFTGGGPVDEQAGKPSATCQI